MMPAVVRPSTALRSAQDEDSSFYLMLSGASEPGEGAQSKHARHTAGREEGP